MARRRDNVNFTLIIGTIVVSALLHALLWPVGDEVLRTSWTPPPAPSDGVMEVSLLGEAPPEEEPEVVADDTEFVQLDRVDKERPPPPTRHRAEFDNRVEKETKAPNRRPTPGAPAQTPGQPDERPNDTPKPSEETTARSLDLTTRGNAEPDEGVQAAEGDLAELARGEAEPKKGSVPPGGGMLGTPEALQKTFGNAGTFDALEGVEPGKENILNSKRNRYASFFNRVRNGIAQHWEPAQVHRARDPDGRVFGAKTRRTHLVIRLNPDGTLAKIMLLQSSDAPHLDEEAIRAVRQAVPFYNPPAGLIDPKTGFIEFGFGFIFELNKKPRIFRYRR